MKKNKILNLMVIHHGLLETLWTVFRDNLDKNRKRAEETLNSFQWELEKHFFSEEKVIFRFCTKEDSESCKLVKKLWQEHTVMLEMLNQLKNDLIAKAAADTAEFHEFMIKHRELEEKELYPRLDRELLGPVKEEIIARINEIPIQKR